MTNEELIKAVEKHQSNPFVHPLTCGVSSSHELLIAEEKDGEVVLVCPTCGHVQKNIGLILTPLEP